jgi:hypothetical protein
VLLAGCGATTVDFTSEDTIRSSAGAIASRLDGERPGKGLMFARSLYRAANPPAARALADDFDPLQILAVATDRGQEPAALSVAWARGVAAGARRLQGLEASDIVAIYVAQDLAALKEQEAWAKGFDQRVRRRLETMRFDASRRRAVVDRVTPRKAGYRWTSGSGRIPVLDFEIYNPIDRPLTGVDFAVDLLDPAGRVVSSALVPFEPTVALQPGVFAQYAIDMGSFSGFNDPSYRDLRDPMRVSVKVKDIYVDDHQSVLQAKDDSARDDARRIAIGRLLSAIADARINLSKYRIAFG